MRGKAASHRISNLSNTVLVCVLLIAGASGCKKKADQVSDKQESEAVSSAPVEEKEIAGEQPKQEAAIEEDANQIAFDMHEASVFDLDDEISRDFLRGRTIFCNNQISPGRSGQYPHFKSAEPIHGMINFAGKAVGPSPPRMYYHLVIDESGGTGKRYDRLYFDRDGDGDLTDEKPLKPLKTPPKGVLRPNSTTELQVCFEPFEMTFDFGPAGKHAVELMAHLTAHSKSPRMTLFPTKVRRGEIEIGGAKYEALLGYGYSIGKPFDQPGTVFHLTPKGDPQNAPRWWGANTLNAIHEIDGTLYRFATTPTGDKLFARPYEGALGTFEVGSGGRDIQDISIQGSLRSEETALAIGDGTEHGWPKPTTSCRLPEGDYLPAILTFTVNKLRISISDNYHTDGKPRGRNARDFVYGIKIREDKPYVFDLANEPNVLFASPKKDTRVRLGDSLEVKAVLIDPELGIMIRGIDDTSQKQKKEYTRADGEKISYEVNLSLDPKVVITRANGDKVAEGVMPFG
jgi:hypothetical protein